MTATISTDTDIFTMVNVFPVDPADQRRLFDILTEATDVIKRFPGYVSANIHLSHDGRHVVNYAQWRSEADFKAMHSHPDVKKHFAECRELSTPQPIMCRVAYTHDSASNVRKATQDA
jgi:hypothetical protein